MTEIGSAGGTARVTCELKLPSLNEYIRACRSHPLAGARMKKDCEEAIGWFIRGLPRFQGPVRIRFTWLERDARRDLDNVAFGKKFILDALVKLGKLKDDNRRCVVGFSDEFRLADRYGVIIEIEEVRE